MCLGPGTYWQLPVQDDFIHEKSPGRDDVLLSGMNGQILSKYTPNSQQRQIPFPSAFIHSLPVSGRSL